MGTTLRQFIAENRPAFLDLCSRKLKADNPDRPEDELLDQIGTVLDEIVGALARDGGLPDGSPLPGKSAAAGRHGLHRHQRGYSIETLARDFGSISDSLGELAESHGLSFGAREYQVFNLCVDAAIASALEQYWDDAQRRHHEASTQRVGMLAHELRNALSSARMAFAILKRNQMGINSRTGDLLDRGLRRLEDLISQSLLAVQLDVGLKAAPERTSVLALLTELRDLAVPERDIRLLLDVEEGLELDADERLLTSAISNLVQNALKFTRAGGTVTLRARRRGEQVVIEVQDECGGLAPEKQDELFKPFVQRSGDRRGVGLGLTITREAITAHGGHLTHENLPGTGCIFAIELPQVAAR